MPPAFSAATSVHRLEETSQNTTLQGSVEVVGAPLLVAASANVSGEAATASGEDGVADAERHGVAADERDFKLSEEVGVLPPASTGLQVRFRNGRIPKNSVTNVYWSGHVCATCPPEMVPVWHACTR